MPEQIKIPLIVPNKSIEFTLYGESSHDTIVEQYDAIEHGEAPIQIAEGHFYEYEITEGYHLEPSEIVSHSKINKSTGRISPNIYVGTLKIGVIDSNTNLQCSEISLEVQSFKTSYRNDYRQMLEEITEKCTDLLFQYNSPVAQNFEVNFNADSNTLYQRFAFIKSIIDSAEFNESIHKILSSPVTQWRNSESIKDIRGARRFCGSMLRQVSSASNRRELPKEHPLSNTIKSVPSRIIINDKSETVDTPENRFIKHALVSFQSICEDFRGRTKQNTRIEKEASLLIDKLSQHLNHSIFKEISRPTTLPLNSPILQRKEGYREILRVWLMFDLAAKMVWHGGDDIYSGNKKDVAVLYEYWLFFKLLEVVKEVFKIDCLSLESLIEKTKDGLGLKLKQGRFITIKGIYNSDTRKLNVEFSYNKTFMGENSYPHGGSWTRNLRPDYTLSIWPHGIEQEQAEEEELMVHIHFDAKYKIEKLDEVYGINKKEVSTEELENELNSEKNEQKKGTYKRADLLKMHTYRDAIRRTAGAYILYPGDISMIKQGFHELLPGLGAFAIRPSKSDNGTNELKKFLFEVVNHFMNRASQREKISFKTYDTYRNILNELTETLPEAYGDNRGLIPDETYILIAYYRTENWDWIKQKGLYNARAESNRGSLKLGIGETTAKYILLHSESETQTSKLMKIVEPGPRIYSKQTLIKKGYPTEPTHNFYLVYKIEPVKENEFLNKKWDITKLKNYRRGRNSALPFSVTITELMRVLIK